MTAMIFSTRLGCSGSLECTASVRTTGPSVPALRNSATIVPDSPGASGRRGLSTTERQLAHPTRMRSIVSDLEPRFWMWNSHVWTESAGIEPSLTSNCGHAMSGFHHPVCWIEATVKRTSIARKNMSAAVTTTTFRPLRAAEAIVFTEMGHPLFRGYSPGSSGSAQTTVDGSVHSGSSQPVQHRQYCPSPLEPSSQQTWLSGMQVP